MKKLLKSIYRIIPFKRELFQALKFFWSPPESIYRHFHFVGTIHVPVDKSRSFKMKHYGFQVENEIFWSGLTAGWEKESIKLWIRLCQHSKVIFDIGANTGVYSLIAKTMNPDSRVFAFEPVKRVYHKLRENIALNNFDIIAVEKAVSNSDGTALIFDTDSEHTYSVTVGKNLVADTAKAIETKIETVTLNSFVRGSGIKKVDLIKIDVETHEPEVLEGFSDYLHEFKPTILIEILSDEVGQKIYQITHPLNYLYFNIDEKASVRQMNTITKSDYYNYLLCVPSVAIELGILKPPGTQSAGLT